MKVLVKLGGTLLDSPDCARAWPNRLAAAARPGVEMVVVHGGGKQMTRYLAERGIESRFVNGLRVTTPETVDAVLKVFAGSVNHELVASLNRAGALAVGLSGIDALLAEAEQMDPELGAVGRVTKSNAALLALLTANRYLPVVACVAGDRQGRVYNVNADQMAVACAAAFGAAQLIFLTDVPGVLDAERQVHAALLRRKRAGRLIAAAWPPAECRPSWRRPWRRCAPVWNRCGSRRAPRKTCCAPAGRRRDRHPDGDQRGGCPNDQRSLCRRFCRRARGGQRADGAQGRHARHSPDSGADQQLRCQRHHAAAHRFELSEAIRDFTVVTAGRELLGCGALHFYSPAVAEIRSLAVHESAKTRGVGRKLVEALVAEANQYELAAVFAFTYVVEFFNRVGFTRSNAVPCR